MCRNSNSDKELRASYEFSQSHLQSDRGVDQIGDAVSGYSQTELVIVPAIRAIDNCEWLCVSTTDSRIHIRLTGGVTSRVVIPISPDRFCQAPVRPIHSRLRGLVDRRQHPQLDPHGIPSPLIFAVTFYFSPLTSALIPNFTPHLVSPLPPASKALGLGASGAAPASLLGALFLAHYLNRALISPLRTPSRSKLYVTGRTMAVWSE